MLMDWMMMGIRISQGLGQQELLRRANELNRADQIVQVMNMCIDQGWVKLENDHWSLTDSGFHFADRVARDLIGALIED